MKIESFEFKLYFDFFFFFAILAKYFFQMQGFHPK